MVLRDCFFSGGKGPALKRILKTAMFFPER
jgi:hypothetical protein